MTGTLGVLVCEDDRDVGAALAEHLEQRGIPVHWVSSGRSALACIKRESIAVVVMDHHMPPMDGVETAAKIRALRRDVRIIISTACDTPENRNRADQYNLHVERWIDKDENWLDNVTTAVLEALGGAFGDSLSRQLTKAARKAKLNPKQRAMLRRHLDLRSLVAPPPLAPWVGTDAMLIHHRSRPMQLEEVLQKLTQYLDEADQGYQDPALREFGWSRFRELADEHLWNAVTEASEEPHRRQLALQLRQATAKVESLSLQRSHIEAAKLSLGRLKSQNVGPHDVAACKKAWRRASVETLPSLRKVLKDWEKFYHVEGPED